MKCPYCPKEIKEDNIEKIKIGKSEYIRNRDYDKHVKIHINKTK